MDYVTAHVGNIHGSYVQRNIFDTYKVTWIIRTGSHGKYVQSHMTHTYIDI
jgi:hypothetical protein